LTERNNLTHRVAMATEKASMHCTDTLSSCFTFLKRNPQSLLAKIRIPK
jgi:hypothetical protein